MNKGITSLEVLVSVTVIVLLSGMVILYNRRSENTIAIYRDQAQIVAVLNRAKSLAIQTFNAAGSSCGFGVHFIMQSSDSPAQFFIFRDLDCDYIYDKEKDEPFDETHRLFQKVVFASQPPDIVFEPPEPKTFIGGVSANDKIVLQILGNPEVPGRVIKVSGAGQITVE